MSARVMPSQNSETRSQTLIASSGASEFEPKYKEGLTDKLTQDYFGFDTTAGYFPTLRFTDLNVPLGSAKPYCLHIDWIRKD